MDTHVSEFKRALRKIGTTVSVTTAGPVDLKSKYGGVFFYGIHQVDAIIDLLGVRLDTVRVQRHGNGGVVTLTYKDGPLVTMNCINNGNGKFHWSAVGDTTVLDWNHSMDPNPYLTGARTFVRMFRTGKEPFSHERMLAPVAALEAMAKSLRLGKLVRVASVLT